MKQSVILMVWFLFWAPAWGEKPCDCENPVQASCTDSKGQVCGPEDHLVSEALFNHSLFDRLLKEYVTTEGLVRYGELSERWANPNHPLKVYLRKLEEVAESTFKKWNKNEQKAFLINAYHAYTLKLILDHYPVKSIRDIGKGFLGIGSGPWKQKIVKLFGKRNHLDWIEHEMLRAHYKDARLHAVLNCASKSCPALQRDAFLGEKLESQFDQAIAQFINDPTRNRFENGKIELSKIFEWYEGDFTPSVRHYLLKFGEAPVRQIASNDKIPTEYLTYDWSLNALESQ